jgi:hypothetical protein
MGAVYAMGLILSIPELPAAQLFGNRFSSFRKQVSLPLRPRKVGSLRLKESAFSTELPPMF